MEDQQFGHPLEAHIASENPTRNIDYAAALLERLEADHAADSGVTLDSKGRVSRPHYAAFLGLGESRLGRVAGGALAFWDAKLADLNQGLSPIARRFLALIDEDRRSISGIKTKSAGSIYISHYAERLDVSMYRLMGAVKELLPSLEKKLGVEGALPHPAEWQLTQEIERDIAASGRPVFGRGGRLNREHYAGRLGVRTLGKICSHIFDAFDEKYGAASNVETRLEEMREWLTDRYERRALALRGGKVDRKQFQEVFDLRGGTFLVRYPSIRALFEEFDARAAEEGYCPADLENILDRLRKALDSSPELNKDHLTVNRPSLERQLGLPNNRLWQQPYVDEIRQHEAKILRRAQLSSIDPFIGGRVFAFSDLLNSWSKPFLSKLGLQFKKAFSHVDTGESIKPLYLALYHLLEWVGQTDDATCRTVTSSAATTEIIDTKHWELAVFAFRESLVGEVQQGMLSKKFADTRIASLRRVLSRMEPALPGLQTELGGIKHARAFTVHRASLAEATNSQASRPGAEYIDFANNILKQAADRYKVGLDHDEAVRFVEVLAAEMQRSSDLPSDPAHAVLLVLNRRLSAIRDAAIRVMDGARASIVEGKTLLSLADIDGGAFYRDYQATPSKSAVRKELLRQWFPSPAAAAGGRASEAALRRAQANLLAVSVAEFNGILPSTANAKAAAELGQFFQKRYLELGTFETLSPLLNPSREACGAALTLYLIESGANVSVGRTLMVDCIEPANEPSFKLITGHKARAKGKPIYVELPSNSPAIEALEWYAQHGRRYRRKADPSDAESLFVLRTGEKYQVAPPHWYTSWFKQFAGHLPEFQGAAVTPSMIRPSVLLKAALENDGRLQVGRAIGQHSAVVTRGYQEKLPIRLLRDQHMRRFQRHYETRVLQNVVDVARNLGIEADEFADRIEELQATGLGTFCVDPYQRPGAEGQRCQTVDCWRDCPQLLIVGDVDAIATLQIWQKSLNEARGDWERDHPERWGDVWLPWLCLTEVVEERMSRGPLLLVWRKAQKRATELLVSPDFVPPRPF